MLTATRRSPANAASVALAGVAASLGIFGLLRLSWVEAQVVLPATHLQRAVGVALFGAPTAPVAVTLACSGTDALALCLGAILAYPVRWSARLAGVLGGTALILALNSARIGTLGLAAATPGWFNALHLYIWPVVLTLAIAGYVFAWMRMADRGQDAPPTTPHLARDRAVTSPPQASRRFVLVTLAALVAFIVLSPLYLDSAYVLALAGFIAASAAKILAAAGVSAHAAGNVLWTPRGGFLVTQECVATPLLPVYVAAICVYAKSWRWLAAGLLATVPLFTVLGIVRLLVIGLPDAVASPAFAVHAFYQLLLAAVIVFLAALWGQGRRRAFTRAALGAGIGAMFVYAAGPLYNRAVTSPMSVTLDDPQGALAVLPAFQAGLYLAIGVAALVVDRWKRFLAGLAVLPITQMGGLLALQALAAAGLTLSVRDIRAWAVAGPVLIFAAMVTYARPRT